ncbi:E3 ubiquitin-protein ligase EL5 [Sorghum bicolor]|uniref:RING-type domain-containing protein n=2 Tax=Sorghum bicolor TaxID=4558 RepID=A0A1W0VXE0_SORBI|nr:E3 ubiquitin-protein ligase EL5 [Sorghum bicolor]OQU86792.1 hypothetical protein SORBI_3003G147401 [Sorghum bicolor]|eukprot:XP_002455532.1 E3 ubiquitin-protein ligase EL5 [Sorghum bicolor]
MSGQSSSSYGDTDHGTDSASSSIGWAPHGRGMTACLIVVNVVLVALVYLYFWRLFSRKRAGASSSATNNPVDHDDDDDASSTASTPPSSPPTSQDLHDRLVASLPTFVARSGSGAGAECAVCIAELRDGDEGRALPRCGHRFHAACVDAWLRRRHTTCPLCRASVVVAGEEAGPKGSGVTDTTTAAALEDMDAPV